MSETATPLPGHGEKTSNKTRWCELCKCRHHLAHEHFKKGRDKAADTVTGATSGADLGDQAQKGKLPATSQVTLQRLQAEKDAEMREALERRWGRRMRLIYSVASKILDDPKVRLNDEEEKDFGQVHADFAMAWGFAASTKLEATVDVLVLHGTVVASRSKWASEILEKLKGKDDEDKAPTVADGAAGMRRGE